MSDATFNSTPSVREPAADTTYLSAMLKRTSWGAVVAGAVTAISLQMLLSILGIALGATTSDVIPSSEIPQRISIIAGLWWLITGTISLYVGGCVVGRFAGMVRSPDVLLHALVMWAVTAIVGFVLLSGVAAGLSNNVNFYAGNDYGRTGTFPMTSGQQVGNADRVVLTSDTAGRTNDQTANKTSESQDIDSARRLARNAAWWTLIALLTGIGVSLGGAWSTAPRRIVVRPTTVHD